jgi:hypothetical protein
MNPKQFKIQEKLGKGAFGKSIRKKYSNKSDGFIERN